MAEKPHVFIPRFAPGTVVTEPSMVVDVDGKAWWVRPESMVAYPVEAPVDNPELRLAHG